MRVQIEQEVRDIYLEALGEGKYIYLSSWGSSMYPFVKNYDILTADIPKDSFKIGDIVLFDGNAQKRLQFVTHRIVDIKAKNGNISYFIKGDNCAGGIVVITQGEQIKGRVKQIRRGELVLDLSSSLAKKSNACIAYISYKAPWLLMGLRKVIDLFIEWPWILKKIKRRLHKGPDPFLYNTEELLIILARSNLDPRLTNRAISIIKEGLYWTQLYNLACQHGVSVLVYKSLKKLQQSARQPSLADEAIGDVRIPQFVLERLKSAYLYLIAKNAAYYKREKDILTVFSANNVAVIPLKGLFLSKKIYADINARGLSADFDLLVEEKDKEKGRILLETAGYISGADTIRQWQWVYIFTKLKEKAIELHWDITMMCRSKERIKGLWQGTRLIEETHLRYYELKEEELLLYLAAHLLDSSRLGQLRYVCDINELLCKYRGTLDWASITDKAQRWRLSNSLYAAVRLSRDLFNTKLPLGLLETLRPNLLKLLLIKLLVNKKVILRDSLRKRLINNFLSYIFLELLEARSVKEYLSIVKRVLFPPQAGLEKRSYVLRSFQGLGRLLVRISGLK